jgi:hypothetical protein
MTKSPITKSPTYSEVLPQGYDAQRAKLAASGQPVGLAPTPATPKANDVAPDQDAEEP